MEAIAACGVDIILSGHLHLSHADFDEQATFVLWIRDGQLARYEGHVDPDAVETAIARSLPGGG